MREKHTHVEDALREIERAGRCPICGRRHEPPFDAGFRLDWALLVAAVIVALAAVIGGLGYDLWLMSTT